jgi:CheY-like chemotaxis protein
VTTSTRLLEVDLLKQLAPSLIVLDLIFDGLETGPSYLTLIRDDPELALIPVIVCTGAKYLLDALPEDGSGMNVEIVGKPFDLEEVLAAVEQSLLPCPEPAAY